MAKIIGHAPKPEKLFSIGQTVSWTESVFDGRCGYNHFTYTGNVIKVCRVNLHVEDKNGNVWEVKKDEIDN